MTEQFGREDGTPDSGRDRRGERLTVLILVFTAINILIGYRDAIANIVEQWGNAEYNHGYLIPFIAVYIAIQQRQELRSLTPSGRWIGIFLILVGLAGSVAGDLAALYVITHYALILTIIGLVIIIYGIRSIGVLWPAFAYLLFMIPLPDFLYNSLSTQLQLVSSAIGVAIIRLLGITVFLEGNVIDLGVYQLQVVEACSGLRYLFPLMSFGFLIAVLYRDRIWPRLVLFLSTIPIAILMNSFRIGIIGLLVEHQGVEAAQGFLHLFEGWVIFVACLAILFGEALLLHKAFGRTESIWDVLAPRVPMREIFPLRPPSGRLQPTLIIASAAIFLVTLSSLVITNRSELVPKRLSFLSFPLDLEDWHGHEEELPADILEALHLDDYLNINFVDASQGTFVNLYVAYYASQRKGASAHSPKSCIPGGGWEIDRISTVKLDGVRTPGLKNMIVNRVIIVKGSSRQLVYYWFQQRGRIIANEYMVKWYMFADAIMRQRTDGAMVRLVTPLGSGEDPGKADAELVRFITRAKSELDLHIPN